MIPREVLDALDGWLREIVREEIAAVVVTQPQTVWMTVAEASEYLRVSQRTLERLLAAGEVRSTVVERRRIIRREWLDEYAAAGEDVAPTTPPRRRRRTVRGANHALPGGQHEAG